MDGQHMHGMLSGNHEEHMAALGLVDPADATHIAIASGDWFDPATWADGLIPGDDARVHIPDGIHVDYAGESDARVFSIGVEGDLSFAPDVDSTLIVDTLVVAPGGGLEIGTASNPVTANVDIVIANNGAIDVSWDPQLLSRGIVSLGEVSIHGSEIDSHEKVTVDPMAGDDHITMAELPNGWQAGDTIVIAGTHNPNHSSNHYKPDYRGHTSEERTITRIEDNKIYFDEPLEYDHDTPREDLKTSVANYSRTVTIRSEDGADSEVYERGHVMMMGSDDVDIRYAAFDELGRTDKSFRSEPASEVENISFDSNVQGRYSLHLHKLGIGDLSDEPIMIEGNAVTGSPGWGIAQHSSHADLHNNATLDIWGASYVSEAGDEVGTWSDNISIGNVGTLEIERNHTNVAEGDLARTGNGFWMQSRMIETLENVAVAARTGFVWINQGSTEKIDPSLIDQPDSVGFGEDLRGTQLAISQAVDNEVFGSERGFTVTKGFPNQGHDIRTVIDGFDAWEVRTGIKAIYTSHYTFKNIDLIATSSDDPLGQPKDAIVFSNNTSDMVLVAPTIDGFRHAYDVSDFFTASVNPSPGDKQVFIIDDIVTNLSDDLVRQEDGGGDRLHFLTSDDLNTNPPEYTVEVTPIGETKGYIFFEGTRTDGLGDHSLELGTDNIFLKTNDVRHIMMEDGYFELEDGSYVVVIPNLYQDRLTGEITKQGHLVKFADDNLVNNSYFRAAELNGPLPTDNPPPVAGNDTASTYERSPVKIDLLANDTDVETHDLKLDGFVQPRFGKVVDNGDGTATYTPNADFVGDDAFEYWVTDGYGQYTKGFATVTVQEGENPNPVVPPMDDPDDGHAHGDMGDEPGDGDAAGGGDDPGGDSSGGEGMGHGHGADMGGDEGPDDGGSEPISEDDPDEGDPPQEEGGSGDEETPSEPDNNAESEEKSGLAKLIEAIMSIFKSLFGGGDDEAPVDSEPAVAASMSATEFMAQMPTVAVEDDVPVSLDAEDEAEELLLL